MLLISDLKEWELAEALETSAISVRNADDYTEFLIEANMILDKAQEINKQLWKRLLRYSYRLEDDIIQRLSDNGIRLRAKLFECYSEAFGYVDKGER